MLCVQLACRVTSDARDLDSKHLKSQKDDGFALDSWVVMCFPIKPKNVSYTIQRSGPKVIRAGFDDGCQMPVYWNVGIHTMKGSGQLQCNFKIFKYLYLYCSLRKMNMR
ncbi:hypothetical protein NPIL_543261 [Nephila pilipes]|uniref:Uncharacterized protein n=1 Tax=Nephila pilipes TaxID=299642 RepID=A0A8X6U9K5_NEPPI|nr:hypothetical protein NPIL_543261 [Nephila pilipes]